MFDFLQGELVSKGPDGVTVLLGGIGFRVLTPLSTYEALPSVGKPVRLLTHMHVREREGDAVLYGFATELERDMFRMLTGVSHIGPAVAMRVVSSCPPDRFKRYILDEDADSLGALVKGIGAKTARRLIVELQGRVKELAVAASEVTEDRLVRDTVQALISLGESRQAAEKAVRAALARLGSDVDQQTLMHEALSN